jgi:hypothetical protein
MAVFMLEAEFLPKLTGNIDNSIVRYALAKSYKIMDQQFRANEKTARFTIELPLNGLPTTQEIINSLSQTIVFDFETMDCVDLSRAIELTALLAKGNDIIIRPGQNVGISQYNLTAIVCTNDGFYLDMESEMGY